MKKLFLLLFLAVVSEAQIVAVDGADSRLNILYASTGLDATNRNMYDSGTIGYEVVKRVTIYFNEIQNRWEIKAFSSFSGYDYSEVVGYNTNTTTPTPPESGWQKNGFSGLVNPFINGEMSNTVVYIPGTKTAHCNNCNWSESESWTPNGVPRPFDSAIVNGAVVQNSDIVVDDLTINLEKSLTGSKDRSITVKNKLILDGSLSTGRLEVGLITELDGTKLNVKQLKVVSSTYVTLTGNLSVYDADNPGNELYWIKGAFDLGDFNISTYGANVNSVGNPPTEIIAKTSGGGRLRYYFKPGWTGNTKFNFGKGATYMSIYGTANTGGNPFLISVGIESPKNFTVGYVKSIWNITTEHIDHATSPTFGISFYWESANDVTDGFNLNSVYIRRLHGGIWANVAGPNDLGYTGTTYPKVVSVSNISEFSSWGVFDSDVVLPVTLTEFKAVAEGSIVVLNWATTEETNSGNFEVEHGNNGKDWQKIGEVTAKGESTVLERYTYTHHTPMSGDNYYRLKMVDRAAGDRDETFAYSRIRVVKVNSDPVEYLYPNPTTDKIFLKHSDLIKKTLLLNNSGNIVLEKSGNVQDGISVTGVAPGVYILNVLYSNGSTRSQKVIID